MDAYGGTHTSRTLHHTPQVWNTIHWGSAVLNFKMISSTHVDFLMKYSWAVHQWDKAAHIISGRTQKTSRDGNSSWRLHSYLFEMSAGQVFLNTAEEEGETHKKNTPQLKIFKPTALFRMLQIQWCLCACLIHFQRQSLIALCYTLYNM